jgi:hypothetical protein
MHLRTVLATALLFTAFMADARAIDGPPSLSGPRLGATYVLTPGPSQLDAELGIDPLLSQFGWQFEHRFFEQRGGFCGLNEFVFLLGGLDQASFLPTASWIIGVRSYSGLEIGAGPIVSLAEMASALNDGSFGLGTNSNGEHLSMGGVGFAVAAGVTLHSGGVDFPFNLVMVRSEDRYRLSLLAGFTLADVMDEE